MTKIIASILKNLVTPKAAAKREHLFNKPEAGWLNKSSGLSLALGVTKFTKEIDMILVTLCCAT
jgi:hypothetical protein